MAMDVSAQIRLLLEHGLDSQGQSHNLAEVAAATGIRYQTLANLINGKATNPRLKTLQALCGFYHLSLDYFACETEQACLDYLAHHRMCSASPFIHDLADEANKLTPRGQRNVLKIMTWMELAQLD